MCVSVDNVLELNIWQ